MSPDRRRFLATIGPLAPLIALKPGTVYDLVGAKPQPTIKGRLALVVGHTRLRPGAYGIGTIGSYEYPFHVRLSKLIARKAVAWNVETRTFFRDIGGVKHAYRGAFDWGADAVIELHFNATGRRRDTVCGTETLSAGGERVASYQLANAIHQTTLKVLERPDPLNRGVKTCRLRQNHALPAILTEPVFGNNTGDARLLASRQEVYADSLVEGFLQFQKIKKMPQQARPVAPTPDAELPQDLKPS